MAWTPEKLRSLRLELGWSRAEMGRRMGMDANRWASIEEGHHYLDLEGNADVEALSLQLRDYSKRLRFSANSEPHLKESGLNQISEFDIESRED